MTTQKFAVDQYAKQISVRMLLLCIAFVLVLLFGNMGGCKKNNNYRVLWDTKSNSLKNLDKEHFYILLFPATNAGIKIGKQHFVKRAFFVNLNESQQKEIKIYCNNHLFTVERNKLTPYPDLANYIDYISALNKEIISWGKDTDWRRVNYEVTAKDGKLFIVVTVKGKGGYYTKCAYTCDAQGNIIPQWLKLANNRL